MKLMKTIIALALSATGSAALPIPKAAARTAAKHSAAAAAGEPKKAFALDPKESFAPAATAFPVKQDDAPQRRLDEVDNPWTLIKSGAVCNADYADLGLSDTIDGCADKCAHAEGCRFFNYGTGSKTGQCFHDKTSDGTCSEGWFLDSFNFYVRTASPISYNLATKNYILNNFCTDCPSGYECATDMHVVNNVCTACPSGFTCDGAAATACDKTKYVLNNECKDCPSGHTCDGAKATACAAPKYVKDNACVWPKLATAAERAECLAGSEGSCAKCCAGITGECKELTQDGSLDSLNQITLTDEDDCVFLEANYNKVDATFPRLKRPWLFLASARRVGRRRRRCHRRQGQIQHPLRQRLPRPSGIPVRRRLVRARAARRSRRRFAHA